MGSPIQIVRAFKGLNNTVAPARLVLDLESGLAECSESNNIRFDATGAGSMRKGMTLRHGGNFHSAWVFRNIGYVGLDDSIYQINPDISLTGVCSGMSGDRIAYCWTPLGVYYGNGRERGILRGDKSFPWLMGTPRKDSTRSYSGPPVGLKHIELFSQQLLVSVGDTVYRSRPNDYGLYRLIEHNLFPGPVRMIKAVAGGVYFSDDKRTYFASGNDPDEWVRRTVMESPAKEWSPLPDLVDPKDIGQQGDDGWACWVSDEGLVFGSPQGTLDIPTQQMISFPSGFQIGAVVKDGMNFIYNMHQ